MRAVIEPKMFVLLGPDVCITYTLGDANGSSELRYRGDLPKSVQLHVPQPLDLTFRGEQVRSVQTELGTLVTVDLEFVPDLRSLAMTVLLPDINLGAEVEVNFATEAIFTSHLTSIGGPALVQGPLETYVFVSLVGTARKSRHVGNSPEVARLYVRKRYPDLASRGQLATIANPVAGEVLPGIDLFYFSVGSKYPIVTEPHARHTLLIDAARGEVVLDLDTDPDTESDHQLALALRAVLAAVTLDNSATTAELVAVIVPLDPYFANPTEGGFVVTPGDGGHILAVWTGERFRYEVDFDADGKLTDLKRRDDRVKPVCLEHRAQAQELLDVRDDGLRTCDVIWDDLTARLARRHYVYEVRTGNGKRAGLAAVEKGPGKVRFVWRDDRSDLLALARDIIEPVASRRGAAEAAQVALTLWARAGAVEHAPMGAPYFTVSSLKSGFKASSNELAVTVVFDGSGRITCGSSQSVWR
jgi:hypothetical protein